MLNDGRTRNLDALAERLHLTKELARVDAQPALLCLANLIPIPDRYEAA
jgi:hypothetical protein